jgi:hypothetical protein
MLHLDAIFVLGNIKIGLILFRNLMSIVARSCYPKKGKEKEVRPKIGNI